MELNKKIKNLKKKWELKKKNKNSFCVGNKKKFKLEDEPYNLNFCKKIFLFLKKEKNWWFVKFVGIKVLLLKLSIKLILFIKCILVNKKKEFFFIKFS